jgi:hypothetical protein
VTDRLDRGDRHDLLDVFGSEVTEAQRAALQSPVMDQCLEVSPELPDLPVFRDERVVDQEQIRNGTEAGDRFLDAALDILGSGLGFWTGLAWPFTLHEATMISLLELDTNVNQPRPCQSKIHRTGKEPTLGGDPHITAAQPRSLERLAGFRFSVIALRSMSPSHRTTCLRASLLTCAVSIWVIPARRTMAPNEEAISPDASNPEDPLPQASAGICLPSLKRMIRGMMLGWRRDGRLMRRRVERREGPRHSYYPGHVRIS